MADFDPVTYRQQAAQQPDPTDGFDPVAYRALKANSPDNPDERDLMPAEDRVKGGFASSQVMKTYLQGNGYKNPQQNKNGDLVAQDPSGRWVKDQTNFFPTTSGTPGAGIFPRIQQAWESANPGKWTEAHLGAALPALGQMGGEGLAALASPLTAGASLPAASMAGGGGAAAGEKLRQKIGQSMGVNNPDDPATAAENTKNVLEQGAQGALVAPIARGAAAAWKGGLEAVPKVIAALPEAIQTPLNALSSGAKNVATKILGSLTGADPEAAGQFIKSPSSVVKAKPLPIARQAESDIESEIGRRGQAVESAQKALSASEGQNSMDSTGAIAQVESQLQEAVQSGKISVKEAQQIRDIVTPHLTTSAEETVSSPWERPAELGPDTPVYRGKHPENGKGDWTLDPREAVAHASPQGTVQHSTLGNIPDQNLLTGFEGAVPGKGNTLAEGVMKDVPRESAPARGFPTTQTTTQTVTKPVTNVDNLLQGIGRTSPGTDVMPKAGFQGAPVSGVSDKYLNQLERVSGILRDMATGSGSDEAERLAAANSAFGQAKDAARIVKPLESDPGMENFARGLKNEGKNAQMEALQKLVTPETFDQLQNLAAKGQFSKGKIGSMLLGGANANRSMSLLGGAGVRAVSPWSLMNNQGSNR